MDKCNDGRLIEELTKDFADPDRAERRSELLCRFADHTLPPDSMAKLQRHVERCSSCAAQVADWRTLQALGQEHAQITEAVCPRAQDWDAYLFQAALLSAPQRQRLAEHLERCEFCQEEVGWLRRLDTSVPLPSPGPHDRALPAAARARLFRPWVAMAATVLLALSALLLYWMKRPVPPHANPYARLIAFPDVDFREFEDYRPADPALAERYAASLRLCREGKYGQARPLLEALGPRLPNNPGVAFLLGYSYYKSGQMEKAFDYLVRAEALPPKSNQRCRFLFYLCLALEKPDRALVEVAEHANEPDWQALGRRVNEIRSARSGSRRT